MRAWQTKLNRTQNPNSLPTPEWLSCSFSTWTPIITASSTELILKETSMTVSEVTDGMELERKHVFVIPPNASMTVSGDRLRLSPREDRGGHMPINHFMRSLAEQKGSSAIGVILSGSGTDGTLGMAPKFKRRAASPLRRTNRVPSTTACGAASRLPASSTISFRRKELPASSGALPITLIRGAKLRPAPRRRLTEPLSAPSSSSCAAAPASTLPLTAKPPCCTASSALRLSTKSIRSKIALISAPYSRRYLTVGVYFRVRRRTTGWLQAAPLAVLSVVSIRATMLCSTQ